jgi:ABC-2 type transport system permease protein
MARTFYLQSVKSKGFIIGTFLIPILWILILVVPGLLAGYFFEKTEMKVAIFDNTKQKIWREIVESDPKMFFLVEEPINSLNKKILDGTLDAYLVVDDSSLANNRITVFTKGGGGIGYLSKIDKNVGKIFRKNLLLQQGLDTNLISKLEKDLKVETKKVTHTGVEKDYSTFYSIFGYFAGIVLFMLIFMYGGIVMRGVVEEKANRIVEILLSSAKPFDIMLGKVIGLGSVGLTQIFIWVVLLSIISLFTSQLLTMFMPNQANPQDVVSQAKLGTPFEIPPIPFEFIVFFIIYFLLGYFMISAIYAGIGAAVDQEHDAQTLIAPLNIVFMLPIFLINIIVGDPNSLVSVLLSLFPPFTPVLMISRMSATEVPFWQLILSVILMIAGILISVKISAKVFRVGVLIYGKKPTFKEIFRWLSKA